MSLCLQHPEFGYYKTQTAIGDLKQDFITAPELSSLFGEIVGAWLLKQFNQTFDTDQITHLIELGPGKGTLMKDVLTCFRQHHPDTPLQVTFLEINPILKTYQSEMMKQNFPDVSFQHIEHIPQCPQGQTLLIANEFFDALPIRGFQKHQGMFLEQIVTLDEQENFTLTLSPRQNTQSFYLAQTYPDLKEGDVVEISPTAETILLQLTNHFENNPAVAFICDYGYDTPPLKSTLRAIKNHTFVDLFETPGKCDLSTFVNFQTLKMLLNHHQFQTSPIMTQADFLKMNGALIRLKDDTTPATDLLLDENNMGGTFKVLTFSNISSNFPHTHSQSESESCPI